MSETESVATEPDVSEKSDQSKQLSKDDVFELLTNRRRRDVLSYLDAHDGTASISDLAEWIAARENDVSPDLVTSRQRKRVYVGLYQTHLPKMADAGVVDYEQGDSDLGLSENASTLRQYVGDRKEDTWYRRYAMVSLGGVGLFAVSQFGAVSADGMVVVTAALVGLFLATTLVHTYTRRSGTEQH